MRLTVFNITFLLISQGTSVSAVGGDKVPVTSCKDLQVTGSVLQEGCLVKTCKSGTVVDSLADECVELIENAVDKILDEKLNERAINEAVTEDSKYKNPGIILAGGCWQDQVKLIKPDSQEVCDLPALPSHFSWASLDIVEGTPVMCGSVFASPGNSRMKNETEKREFFAVSSCVQLSPATKEAEWTIFRDNMPLRREHVSMTTPEGLLLMGGYNSRSVDLLKPDGSLQKGIYKLERTIDRGCGIEVDETLIITGGGSVFSGGVYKIESTKVDRYNSQGFVENLPDMNIARTGHGCGYFYREGKKVLVVGGGYKYLGEYQGYQALSSTETFTMGSNAWSVAAPLPFAVYGFASVSLNNKVIFLANDGAPWQVGPKVRLMEFDGVKWEETQKVRVRGLDDRYKGYRAVAFDLATSGFDEFCE